MPGNVPADLTSLVGRGADVRELRQLMRQSRVLSLTGPGGVGKTRLALAVAAEATRAFEDGVWVVDLTPVNDPELIETSIRDVLPGPRSAVPLSQYLRDRNLLLVLDNCDKLAERVGRLIADLLHQCSALRVLVTSRSALAVSGEQVYEVAPLGLSSAEPGMSDAVALFRDRVHALDSRANIDFCSPEVLELCRRLDGLPLAIELAAMRTRVLSVTEIISGLQARFDLLDGGPCDIPTRHQSLRALISWSWEQCSAEEQRLWSRLAVFGGSATLDAILAVGEFDRMAGLHVVESLVRRSVLQRTQQGEISRYRLLDTIREFGDLMLREGAPPAEIDALRRRHANYYLNLADRAAARWFGPDQQAISALTNSEIANIRAALETALADPDQRERAANTVAALWFHWIGCGHLAEGVLWCEKVVAAFAENADPVPSSLQWVRSWIQLITGDAETAQRTATACLEQANSQGDTREAAYAHAILGAFHGFRGDRAGFGAEYHRAITLAESSGDVLAVAMFLVHQAEIRSLTGEVEVARFLCERSAELCEAHGDRWCLAYTVWVRMLCHYVSGDLAGVLELAPAAARLALTVDDHMCAVMVSEVAAWSMIEENPALAATLLAATGRYWEHSGKVLLGFTPLVELREAALTKLATRLTPAQRDQAAEAARRLTTAGPRALLLKAFDDLADLGEPVGDAQAQPGSRQHQDLAALQSLTARELEIALIVGTGKTNQEIANELVIGRRTVDTHVSNILAKLGARRRSEVAALVSGGLHPST